MLRRGIYLLGSTLLRRNAFTFHLASKPLMVSTSGLLKTPMFRFASELPPHEVLNMPALSPTMSSGKIVKWYKKVGDPVAEGDVLCDVETDKATVPFEVLEKGFVAQILLAGTDQVNVGEPVVVLVRKQDSVAAFANYKGAGKQSAAKKAPAKQTTKEAAEPAAQAPKKAKAPPAKEATEEVAAEQAPKKKKTPSPQAEEAPAAQKEGGRVVASPYAKKSAEEAGIDITALKGTGPGGRIIKQDIDAAGVAPKQPKQAQQTAQKPATKVASKKVTIPTNPFEEIPLTSMRKIIAARLVESKTTVPHYYATMDINMDKTTKLREELNAHEKDNGVKISINDFIMKATALASRDYPDVNVQWHETAIRKFKYVDLAMAVATDKGLITPIIFRADTKGLLDIAKASKELAKKARESRLLPQEFQGGTCSVSNLGMFGVNSIYSIINPPHSLILGVGKSEKKIIFDEHAKDQDKPYKVASIMTLVASADHRVVDGALTGQWLSRIKKYLEEPTNMLL